MTDTPLDLGLLHRLLGVPEHEGTYRLVRRAQQTSGTLAQLVVSVAASDGAAAGSGSRDLLERARARAVRYAELRSALTDCAGVRVVKGPSLAEHYPAGVRRPVGDLDLVAAEEEQLWPAARTLCALGGEPAELSLFTADGRLHVMLALLWPSPDPLMEEEIRVELCTAAFAGDFDAVPVRPHLPADQSIADLLAVAEERFQREFHAKDTVDVLMLLDGGRLDLAAVSAAAAAYQLAPELLALLDLLGAAVDHPRATALRRALAKPAAEETARRGVRRGRSKRPAGTVEARLATGGPVWGMPLTHKAGPVYRCVLEHHTDMTLARTAVGDFLIVASELVNPDVHAAALAAVANREVTP